MRRVHAFLVLASVCLLGGTASAQTVVRHLEVEADLAAKQAASLVERYQQARAREEAALSRVAEAAGELDRRLALEAAAPEELEALERRLLEARGAAEAAGSSAAQLRGQLLELRRRQAILAAELGRVRRAPADLPDPLTGSWDLVLQPGDHRGLLDLTLDATTVSGTLGLDDGSFGSVTGSLTAGALRLERLSAESGLDMMLEGRLEPASGALTGTWRPLVLGRGESPGGTWRATKAGAEGSEEP
ncbi:MAG TPA: hypothetical protein VM599_01255 [Thermoanaerobaculia bacterium]|nr:hypothetical protein [Thermoanaerobaculia bacterium]